MFGQSAKSPVDYDREKAEYALLHNAKLKVEIRHLKRELIQVEELAHLGSELGFMIRTVASRLHPVAPSLAGHPVEVIETRLKGQEEEIFRQLNTLGERVTQGQEAASK